MSDCQAELTTALASSVQRAATQLQLAVEETQEESDWQAYHDCTEGGEESSAAVTVEETGLADLRAQFDQLDEITSTFTNSTKRWAKARRERRRA